MHRPWLTLLLGLLALSHMSVFCAEVEDEDYTDQERALLVVRKFVKEGSAVQGRNLTVSVSVYNAGSSTALNVELEDAKLPAAFQLVAGSLSAKFERIPLASNVTHEYVVVATAAKGTIVLAPATVKYQAELESEAYQVGISAATAIHVLTPTEQIQNHLLTTGSWVTLGMCKTGSDWRNLAILVFLIVSVVGGNWSYKTMTSAKQKWNREKNLKDFGLDSDDDGKKQVRKSRRQATEEKEN